MTKVRILYFLILFLTITTFSGCDTKNDFENTFNDYFLKYYGEDGEQQGVDMIVDDSDKTILLLGNSISPEGITKMFFVKVDWEGNVLIQKTLGVDNEIAVDIEPGLNSGEYVILSNIFQRVNVSKNEYDTKLRIINADGDILSSTSKSAFWTDQVGYSVTPISNAFTSGGYMIAGNTSHIKKPAPGLSTPPPDLQDIIVMFYNSDLSDTLWTISVNNQHTGAGVKVFESDTYDPLKLDNDRPFYLFGYSDALSDGEGPADYEENLWAVSLKEEGYAPSTDIFADGDKDFDEKMSQTIKAIGAGFVSVGTLTDEVTNTRNIVLTTSQAGPAGLEFDDNQQKIVVSQSQNLTAVSITPSIAGGRYLILSNETSPSGTTNIWLSKVDVSGNVYWSSSFGALTKNDFAGTVKELPDGKIVVLGTVELESKNSKMALIKLNAKGEFLN